MEEAYHAGVEVAFQAYIQTLDVMKFFKYLRRVLTVSDDDWMLVLSNLSKYWKKWARMLEIFGQEGEYTRTSSTFYKRIPG